MAYDDILEQAAVRHGVPVETLRKFMRVESGGNASARTGSYKGLFQLSDSEFSRHGGGNIYDPTDNANAAAAKIARETQAFSEKYGRAPTASDLYMIHQQGSGGYAAHTANPSAPAWQNMASTAEGRLKGPNWARRAIWGNMTPEWRARFGSVDNVTSQDFMDAWAGRLEGGGGGGGSRGLPGAPSNPIDAFHASLDANRGGRAPGLETSVQGAPEAIQTLTALQALQALQAPQTAPAQAPAPADVLGSISSAGGVGGATRNFLQSMLAGRAQNNALAWLANNGGGA